MKEFLKIRNEVLNYSVVLVITSVHSLGMHEVSAYKVRINKGSP